MRFVHLTDLAGHIVPIDPSKIEELRPAEGMGVGPGAKTIVVFDSGDTTAVRESPAEIEEKLKCV